MFTFIAFLLTMLGCVNWLMVGLLQYDFIAGLFGFQASIFSRLCYILIGVGAMYLLLRVIVNKGTFKVFERRKKRQNASKQAATLPQNIPVATNVEASKEQHADVMQNNNSFEDDYNYDEDTGFQSDDNLFDEHLKGN